MDMESFYTKSREGKPATATPVPAYTPPLKTEFTPAGPSVTGMGRSRRRKQHPKKTKKNARKSKHRRR
jgi:hypothetical protein